MMKARILLPMPSTENPPTTCSTPEISSNAPVTTVTATDATMGAPRTKMPNTIDSSPIRSHLTQSLISVLPQKKKQ